MDDSSNAYILFARNIGSFVVKLDTAGNLIWTKAFGSQGNYGRDKIRIGPDKQLYVFRTAWNLLFRMDLNGNFLYQTGFGVSSQFNDFAVFPDSSIVGVSAFGNLATIRKWGKVGNMIWGTHRYMGGAQDAINGIVVGANWESGGANVMAGSRFPSPNLAFPNFTDTVRRLWTGIFAGDGQFISGRRADQWHLYGGKPGPLGDYLVYGAKQGRHGPGLLIEDFLGLIHRVPGKGFPNICLGVDVGIPGYGAGNSNLNWTSLASQTLSTPFSVATLPDGIGIFSLWKYCFSCPVPKTNFSFQSTGLQVQFIDTLWNYRDFYYDFGDGITDSTHNPTHSYALAGQYNVCLISSNGCGADTVCHDLDFCDFAEISGPSEACIGDSLVFFSQSAFAVSFQWYDNAALIGIDSFVNWVADTGVHVLGLVVSNGLCLDTASFSPMIFETPPSAGFSFIGNGLSLTFVDTSSSATSWFWDFGDGSVDTVQFPSHTYLQGGNFNICLIVSNSCGSDTVCALYSCQPAIPGFSYSLVHDTITFINQSQNGLSYLWTFGDGDSSTLANPVHVYAQTGVYNICLKVYNACGVNSNCQQIPFSVPTSDVNTLYRAQVLDLKSFAIVPLSNRGTILAGLFAGNLTRLIWMDGFGREIQVVQYGNQGVQGRDLIATSDGKYIMAGRTSNHGAGAWDIFLLKLDPLGNVLWFQTYGDAGDEDVQTVYECRDGGFVIGGHTTSFGNGSLSVYLVRTNANGQPIFSRTIAASNLIKGLGAYENPNGKLIMTGYYRSPLEHIQLAVLDENGTRLFTKQVIYNGSFVKTPKRIQVDCNGRFLVATISEQIPLDPNQMGYMDIASMLLIDPMNNSAWDAKAQISQYNLGTQIWNEYELEVMASGPKVGGGWWVTGMASPIQGPGLGKQFLMEYSSNLYFQGIRFMDFLGGGTNSQALLDDPITRLHIAGVGVYMKPGFYGSCTTTTPTPHQFRSLGAIISSSLNINVAPTVSSPGNITRTSFLHTSSLSCLQTCNNPPTAAFSYTTSCKELFLSNQSTPGSILTWSFGGGKCSNATNPQVSLGTSPLRVTLYASNNCGGDSTFVIILPVLSSTLSLDSGIVCQGDASSQISVQTSGGTPPFLYDIDNAGNFQSSSVFTGLNAGAHAVIVIDSNLCRDTTPLMLIPDGAMVLLALSATPATTGGNGSIAVTASGGTSPYTYSLDNFNFQNNGSFPNLSTGSYIVYARDANGCISQDSIYVGGPLGLGDTFDMLRIYPNPAQKYLIVNYQDISPDGILLQFIDIKGRILKSHRQFQSVERVSVADFPNAVYIIRLNIDGKEFHRRFVKM